MPRKNESWGIEVGANALKAVRLVRHGSDVHMVDFDVMRFKQVLTTPDLDANEQIQLALDALIQKHDLHRTTNVVSVPGHLAFARFAKLPPVEPKKVQQIVQYEAQQQIPFPIEQVEWDYQVFAEKDSPDVEVGIFAITKERVLEFLNNYNLVNMRVDALTLSPLAVYNAFHYDNAGTDEADNAAGRMYMDIGTVSTDLIIVEDEGIWIRTFKVGGNDFTEALVKQFKISFAKAEKLKREMGSSKYRKQMFQAMRPVFADLVQEVQRSIGAYQQRNLDAEIEQIVGVGSTFRLPGLQKFLKQQLGLEVIRPDRYHKIEAEGKREAEFAENAMNLSTAYGCAIQGLGLERVSANVLPRAILHNRLWSSKQPWIAAAAAAVVVAAGLAGVRYYTEEAAFVAGVQETDQQMTVVKARAQGFIDAMNGIDSDFDPRVRIENLRRSLDYREIWPDLMEDISLAAMSLNPNPALLTNEYEKIAEVPWGSRTRLYIDQIEAIYEPMPAQPGGQAPSTTGAELITQSFTPETFFTGAGGPRFVITIQGRTPSDTATADLAQFVRWFEQNSERPDRPYKLFASQQTSIISLGAAEPAGEVADRPGAPGSPGTGVEGSGSRFGTPRALPGSTPRRPRFGGPRAGTFDEPGTGPGGGGGGGPATFSIDELIPRRPDASIDGLVRPFTLQIVLELRPLDQSRQSETAQPTYPSPGLGQPATAPPPAPTPAPAPGEAEADGPSAAAAPAVEGEPAADVGTDETAPAAEDTP